MLNIHANSHVTHREVPSKRDFWIIELWGRGKPDLLRNWFWWDTCEKGQKQLGLVRVSCSELQKFASSFVSGSACNMEVNKWHQVNTIWRLRLIAVLNRTLSFNHSHPSKLQVFSKGVCADEPQRLKLISVVFRYLQYKYLCPLVSLGSLYIIIIGIEFDPIFGIYSKMAWITPWKCFFLFFD